MSVAVLAQGDGPQWHCLSFSVEGKPKQDCSVDMAETATAGANADDLCPLLHREGFLEVAVNLGVPETVRVDALRRLVKH